MSKRTTIYVDPEVRALIQQEADAAGTTPNNVLRAKYGLQPAPIKNGRPPKQEPKA